MFELTEFKNAVPMHMRSAVTQEMVDAVNRVINDPLEAEAFKDNAITFTSVLKDGKFKMADYLNAVRYVTFKSSGCSNQEAYIRTFPERYADFVNRGYDEKRISSYVSMYTKGKLVVALQEQIMIPLRILNYDKKQEAINVLSGIIANPKASDKNKIEAANTLLTHLADPKENANALNVNINLDGAEGIVAQLAKNMNEIAGISQGRVIDGTATVKEMANAKLVEVDD